MTTKTAARPFFGWTADEVRAWDRPLWVGLTLAGAFLLVVTYVMPHGSDTMAYWDIQLGAPYARSEHLQAGRAFLYSPPMILLAAPLALIPAVLLPQIWLTAQVAALWSIGGRWALALVLFPPVWIDMVFGNINIFLAAMVVAGFRYPAVWAFGLLTKVTPGVGLVWFAVRREWRSLALASAVTAIAVAVSIVVLGTQVWSDWFAVLAAGSSQPIPLDAIPIPLLPRLVLAVGVIAWGASTDRRWTVPVAVTLAMPTWWLVAFTPLVAWWGRRA